MNVDKLINQSSISPQAEERHEDEHMLSPNTLQSNDMDTVAQSRDDSRAFAGSRMRLPLDDQLDVEANNALLSSVPKSMLASNGPGPFYHEIKRALDLLFAAILLTAISPIMLLIALLVKLSSKGPVFFRQRRLKRGGGQFWCYKFRTMVPNAEEVLRQRPDLLAEFQAGFKLKNDPRVTPIGRFLRRTSLDELPQFINVLMGDISLIGPRPIVPHELEKYGAYADRFVSVEPGLSGMWQVYRQDDTSYAERIAIDMAYIKHRCISLDIRLVFATVIAVIRGRGAH